MLTLTVGFPESTRPADCPLTYDIQADSPQGVSLILDEETQLLTVSLDGTIEASDLIGSSYQIEVKGLNTGQSADDVEAFVIEVNFIGCQDVDRTFCATCDKSQFEVEDTENSEYIWSNTKGCTQCRYGWEQYLYESSDGIIRGC